VKHRQLLICILSFIYPLAAFAEQTAADLDKSGDAKQQKGDSDGAIADYTKAIELNPKDARAYSRRGRAKVSKGDYDAAVADCAKAIELDPRFAEAYKNRGIAKENKGDRDGAIVDYSKAIELDPKYAAAYYDRGFAKLKKADYDGANAEFEGSLPALSLLRKQPGKQLRFGVRSIPGVMPYSRILGVTGMTAGLLQVLDH
jgi:tetratricopeptide (TPR) repeat protein